MDTNGSFLSENVDSETINCGSLILLITMLLSLVNSLTVTVLIKTFLNYKTL